MSRFSFVLVGSGNICRSYWQALENLEGVEGVALVSRSGRRPEFLPHRVPVYAALAEVKEAFHAVILCTPNGVHYQGAREAAKLGKHVLTEKVLDINIEHMDSMIDVCESAGVTLGVTFQRRMSPGNQAVKRVLDSGRLGRVFAADMRVKFFRDMAYYDSGDYRGGYAIDGGGPFIQQAAHNVDIFVWFFGMPKQVVSMLDTFTHSIEVEDHGVALLRFPDGMIGTITASTATRPGFAPVLEIHGEKGTVILENDEIVYWDVEGTENPLPKSDFEVHSGADSAAVSDTEGHEAMIWDFVQAVEEGREPLVPASSGRLATELVLKIYESRLPSINE